jgi:hypothetical protein
MNDFSLNFNFNLAPISTAILRNIVENDHVCDRKVEVCARYRNRD